MRRFALLLLPLLAGCATGPSLQSRMAAYIGAPEEKLVQSLGVPDKQIAVNGVDYLAYVHSQAQIQPAFIGPGFGGFGGFGPWGGGGFGPWGAGYGGVYSGGLPEDVQVWSCEVTFTVKDSRVWNVTFKGNDCG